MGTECSSTCTYDRGNQTGGILHLPTYYTIGDRKGNDLSEVVFHTWKVDLFYMER